jgi:hypothetical protein
MTTIRVGLLAKHTHSFGKRSRYREFEFTEAKNTFVKYPIKSTQTLGKKPDFNSTLCITWFFYKEPLN